MKPVCVRCARFVAIKQNGVAFEEMREIEPDTDVGWGPRRRLAPYRLWIADLLACPGCGAQILVTAHDQKPIAEHYHSDYDDVLATLKPSVRVEG